MGQALLDIHNKLRNEIALGNIKDPYYPPAKNMNMLEWDDTLANLCKRNVQRSATMKHDGCQFPKGMVVFNFQNCAPY